MKILVPDYTFSPSTQTITFTDFTSINLNRVLVITDVSTNVMIYNFVNPALGGSVSGNVLTLAFNTSALSANDQLQIFYDYSDGNFDDILAVLWRIAGSLPYCDTGGRGKVLVDATSALGTVSTVSNVTQLNNVVATPASQALTFLASAPQNMIYQGGQRLQIKST
jgi:hypothetical protein